MSGWRDLNSRPLDPQTCGSRIPPCQLVLADAFLSVNPGLSSVLRDLPYPLVASSLLAPCFNSGSGLIHEEVIARAITATRQN